jgi:hypothetical protein
MKLVTCWGGVRRQERKGTTGTSSRATDDNPLVQGVSRGSAVQGFRDTSVLIAAPCPSRARPRSAGTGIGIGGGPKQHPDGIEDGKDKLPIRSPDYRYSASSCVHCSYQAPR